MFCLFVFVFSELNSNFRLENGRGSELGRTFQMDCFMTPSLEKPQWKIWCRRQMRSLPHCLLSWTQAQHLKPSRTLFSSLFCLLFQMLRQNQRAFVNQDKNSQDPSVSVCLQKKTAGMKHSEVCSQIEKTTLAQPVRWRGLTLTHKPQNINFHITETPVFSWIHLFLLQSRLFLIISFIFKIRI